MPETKVMTDSFTEDGLFSVLTQTTMNYNGHTVVLDNYRTVLMPGDTVKAQAILPENMMNAVTALWTQDVIDAWNSKMAQGQTV